MVNRQPGFALQNNAVNLQATPRDPAILQTRRKILNGSELSRDEKANSLIFGRGGRGRFPPDELAGIGWKRETGLLVSVIYLSPLYQARPLHQISLQPLSVISTLETSYLPLGRSGRLALIQLKTPDDRAKQRRIDHENFN